MNSVYTGKVDVSGSLHVLFGSLLQFLPYSLLCFISTYLIPRLAFPLFMSSLLN